ncbi:TetR/AcrR family transcriptional regulator [Niabella hirudinis]|uniref:TetR/AcrR family transcriptional regulator n=1 Tax=Niabella hirudinis TaxID=1285929 RepID=UPI003EC05920
MSKRDLVKKQIGKGAMQCFEKFGLDKTTLEDIAQTVGLNKASLYYYYKNKEDIFVETALREGEDYILALQGRAQQKKGIENQVAYYMQARFKYYMKVLNMNRVSTDTLHKILPRFFELYDALMNREKRFLSELIRHAIGKGELAQASPVQIASVLINISDALKHAAEQMAILKRDADVDYARSLQDMKLLVSLIFRGLKK